MRGNNNNVSEEYTSHPLDVSAANDNIWVYNTGHCGFLFLNCSVLAFFLFLLGAISPISWKKKSQLFFCRSLLIPISEEAQGHQKIRDVKLYKCLQGNHMHLQLKVKTSNLRRYPGFCKWHVLPRSAWISFQHHIGGVNSSVFYSIWPSQRLLYFIA